MVRALLDGRKTQTRRVAKLTDAAHVKEPGKHRRWHPADPEARLACPYGQPGDHLWVREAWRTVAGADDISPRNLMNVEPYTHYEADDNGTGMGRLRPSIHMPRWASRITLEITGVRVERLQDISEADAKAEGAKFHDGRGIGHSGWRHDYKDVHSDARSSYARLWQAINGPGSWDTNPWVWVVEFKRLKS